MPYNTISDRSTVRLEIYNVPGQRVHTLVDEELPAGYHAVVWDAGASTGLYFCRMEAMPVSGPGKRYVDVKKMLLMR